MPIIDIHTHIYPDKVAAKAVESVGEFYVIEMEERGTAAALLSHKETTPITHFVIHSVATKPGNVESINDFIAENCRQHPEFIGFATMHQDYPDVEREVERAIGLGLKGFKIHPDSQRANLDDPRFMRLYECIEGRLPIIIHTGDYRYDFSHPRRLQNALHTFPKLVVNAAHFGGWSIPDLALEYLENENCFMDVSSSMRFLGNRRTKELVRCYGADRILFGTDFPMWDPTLEYNLFREIDFTEEEFDLMLWKNAERFLGFPLS